MLKFETFFNWFKLTVPIVCVGLLPRCWPKMMNYFFLQELKAELQDKLQNGISKLKHELGKWCPKRGLDDALLEEVIRLPYQEAWFCFGLGSFV